MVFQNILWFHFYSFLKSFYLSKIVSWHQWMQIFWFIFYSSFISIFLGNRAFNALFNPKISPFSNSDKYVFWNTSLFCRHSTSALSKIQKQRLKNVFPSKIWTWLKYSLPFILNNIDFTSLVFSDWLQKIIQVYYTCIKVGVSKNSTGRNHHFEEKSWCKMKSRQYNIAK